MSRSNLSSEGLLIEDLKKELTECKLQSRETPLVNPYQQLSNRVLKKMKSKALMPSEIEDAIDGLVVEGAEGGGFKNPKDVSTMVLLPLVRSKVDVPIIAAGGFVGGASMAAAFALGAEAVQMGTRMVSAAESPVHDNWKNAIVQAKETDTVFLNRAHSPALRALRTEKTSRLELDMETNAMTEFGRALDLYFGGDMESSIALTGQVAGRIDSVRPVADIIEEVADEFFSVVGSLSRQYV